MSPASNLVDLWGLALSTCCFTACEFTPAGTPSRVQLFILDCVCPRSLELCTGQILLPWKMGALLSVPPLAIAWQTWKRTVKYFCSQERLSSGDVLVAAGQSGNKTKADLLRFMYWAGKSHSWLSASAPSHTDWSFPSQNVSFLFIYLFIGDWQCQIKGIHQASCWGHASLWSPAGRCHSLLHSLAQAKQAQGVEPSGGKHPSAEILLAAVILWPPSRSSLSPGRPRVGEH